MFPAVRGTGAVPEVTLSAMGPSPSESLQRHLHHRPRSSPPSNIPPLRRNKEQAKGTGSLLSQASAAGTAPACNFFNERGRVSGEKKEWPEKRREEAGRLSEFY